MRHSRRNREYVSQPAVPYPGASSLPRTYSSGESSGRAVWIAGLVALVFACSTWWLWTNGRRTHRELDAAHSQILEMSNTHTRSRAELKTLRARKAELEKDLHAAQASDRDLSARLAAAEGQLGEYKEEHSFVEEQLSEFRKMTAQFESMIDSGRLDVSFRRGRMVVELPAELMFPSGEADLTPEGKASLGQVAKILRGVKGRRFVVAGHTDHVPVSGSKFANNWELSVARALHTTEALIAAGVRPQQLMAAGRSQYEPVASNATARGRQRNRRIEIVLEPYLVDVEPSLDGDGEVDVD